MKNLIRITLVSSILIGGTMSFGYWSLSQFDSVFDNLSAASVANTLTASSFLKKNAEVASTSASTLASTSPEVSTNAFATSTDPELSFTFLHKDVGLYIGCTYPISWQASTTIRSLEATLVDAGTRDPVEQKISGLAKENTIEDSQHISWKVGEDVVPGAYYIKISKIYGAKAVVRSSAFAINKMPEGLDEKEKTSMCR